MDTFETIAQRHSYRGEFLETKIPRENLRKIVQAAIQAPSGKNSQTTNFIIVDDPTLLQKISFMQPSNMAMRSAKAFIGFIIDRQPPAIYEGFSFQIEDCAAAVENTLLAITALGYASVWIDGWLRVAGRADAIGKILGIPENKILRVILPVGVPKERCKQPEKKPFSERAYFNVYGQVEKNNI